MHRPMNVKPGVLIGGELMVWFSKPGDKRWSYCLFATKYCWNYAYVRSLVDFMRHKLYGYK